MRRIYYLFFILAITLSSCESAEERSAREYKAEQLRLEKQRKLKKEERERVYQLEQERIEQERQAEIRKKEQALYDKYINNSLRTGQMPYAKFYGRSNSCSGNSCSQIKVRTSSGSDVLVTIKKNGTVYRHAYIQGGSSYTFELPNGYYQPFFYYGKGWNPNKEMKRLSNGVLKGGFISRENFGKDSPQKIYNNILTYKLIMQENGNFSTQPSNSGEAF